VADWLVPVLLVIPWIPVLVLLHEAAHAFAALALTDGEVSISLRGAGILGLGELRLLDPSASAR
jgi:hypothetical protein